MFFFPFSVLRGECVGRKHEEKQKGPDHLSVILVLFLTSDFSNPISEIMPILNSKRKPGLQKASFFFLYLHNHLSPQALTRLHTI